MIETCSFLTTSWNAMLMYVRMRGDIIIIKIACFRHFFTFFWNFRRFSFFHFWIFFERLFCARARKEFSSRNAFPLLVNLLIHCMYYKILKNTKKQQLSIPSYTLHKSPYHTGPEGIPTKGVIL